MRLTRLATAIRLLARPSDGPRRRGRSACVTGGGPVPGGSGAPGRAACAPASSGVPGPARGPVPSAGPSGAPVPPPPVPGRRRRRVRGRLRVRRGRLGASVRRPDRGPGPVARARLAPHPAHHPARRQHDEQHGRGSRQPHGDRAVGGGAHLQAARRAERPAGRAAHRRLDRELPRPHDLRADLHLPPAQRRDPLRRDRRDPQAGRAGDAQAHLHRHRQPVRHRQQQRRVAWCPASTGWAGSARGPSRAAPRSGLPPPWPPRRRGPAARARRPTPAAATACSRGVEGRVDGGADPRLRHGGRAGGRARPHASRARTRATGGGMSRPPACSGSARRRAAPGVVGPAATTSREPARLHRPVSSSRSTASSSARGARRRRCVHTVRRGEDDRAAPAGAARPGRGTTSAARRVLGGQRRARRRPCGHGRGRGAGHRGRRTVRGRVGRGGGPAQQRVGEHGEQRRRPRPASGTTPAVAPRAAVDGVRGEHAPPGAGGGDVVERRLVEHPVGGPGGVVGHRGAEGVGDDLPPLGDGRAGRGR